MPTKKLASAMVAAFLATVPIAASASDDPRIFEASYDPTAVYSITISPGLATVIELQNDEAVESLVLGDSSAWVVEATSSGDRVVVKPSQSASSTNLMVITTKRTYAFTLNAFGDVDVFVVRFAYPEIRHSGSYRIRGDEVLFPRVVSDNGRSTSIYWQEGTELPVAFTIDADGEEVALQWRAVGDGMIIEGVHDRLIFKRGRSEVTVSRRATSAR